MHGLRIRFQPVPWSTFSAPAGIDVCRIHALVLAGVVVACLGCRQDASQLTPDRGDPRPEIEQTRVDEPDAPAAIEQTPPASPEPWLAALAEFNRGAALMEKYEYAPAALAFAKVLEVAPDWTAARLNLGLAYLNMAGETREENRLGSTVEMTDTAIAILESIVSEQPDNRRATFCLATLRSYQGDDTRALELFERVYAERPDDLVAAYWYAKTLRSLDRLDEAIPVLEQIVERDGGFLSAIYLLGQLYARTRRMAEGKVLLERHGELKPAELAVGTFMMDHKYGMAGPYSLVVGADGLPLPQPRPRTPHRVVFSPAVKQLDTRTSVWSYSGGDVRLAGVAVADVDQDGDLDLLITAQGPDGEAVLFLNDGTGQFTRGASLGNAVVAPCFGDIDNDGTIDLWLGRAGPDRALLNDGSGQFTPAPFDAVAGPDSLTPVSRLVDVDSDGDLDLLAFRMTAGSVPASGAERGAPSSVYSNNTDGSFTDVAANLGLELPDVAVAAVVCDDFDNDWDLDLVLFPANGQPFAWVNFRVWKYERREADALGLNISATRSATSGDPNKDGHRDLLVFTDQGPRLFLNNGRFVFQEDADFAAEHSRWGGTGGQFVDIDNDGDLDIIIGDARRSDGTRGPVLLLNLWPEQRFVEASAIDPGILLTAVETGGDASCVAADFTGNGLPDLLLLPTDRPGMLLENVTSGGHWIAFDLVGKRPQDQTARSNNSAIGARVEVKSGAHFQQYVVGGTAGPVASLPLRVHAGLGEHAKVDWLRILWPDAILQGEVELAANRVLQIEEDSRKPSSCPFLFVWDGTRFTFVSDFGGVGGLGYYLGNGQYALPDPTEVLPLPVCEPLDGHYVLHALTRLEEITYFDEAKLIAVDHPIGTAVYPHEMAAVQAPPPEFELFCVRQPLFAAQAVDHLGRDVTEQLRHVDRHYAGATQRDHRFIGLAAPHHVDLDFADQLASIDPDARLVLFLHGWVEYGYSSTNYAAAQAGERTQAPTIEVLRDGSWVAVAGEVGYPAGLNHMMTVEVTGKIRPDDRRLRVSTNMELYWDQIFLAVHEPQTSITLTEVAPDTAELQFRGYPREYSPDGRHPNLYDYDNLDRNTGWKLMEGDYTRFGDVRELLLEADDCFVIMGHGEQITLRFAADHFGPVPDGYQRSFMLRTHSYCKDMDLYTAHPRTVEPLPFRDMSGYPYPADEKYPDTDKTRHYRATYNTRRVLSP